MMQGQSKGVMTSVRACEQDVEMLLEGDVSVAVVNSPTSCVISGPEDEVEKVEKRLQEKKYKFLSGYIHHMPFIPE